MYKTFYGVLAEAARWLTGLGVTHVAMEATPGIYSMPACHALLAHGDFEKVLVCNAGHVKNVPDRKTDFSDAERLAHLLECGLLAGSFVPPTQVKAARDVIRYRAKVARQRVSEIARPGNVLQDALPASWTRMAPPLTPPRRRLRRVTSAPATLTTSSRTSAGSSSGWVPWFIGSKGGSPRGSPQLRTDRWPGTGQSQ